MELFLIPLCLAITIQLFSVPSQKTEEKLKEVAELVGQVRNGNKQAFNRLVNIYQNKIFFLALNYVKNDEEAKDLAQDIFVTAYKALPKLREDKKFGAWLYQIGLNQCRNRYKKLKRSGYFINSSLDDQDSYYQPTDDKTPEHNIEQQRTISIVRDAIDTLQETEKEIIILRDLQGLAYDEISETLGIPLGTVKSKLNRARHALKNKLKNIHQDL